MDNKQYIRQLLLGEAEECGRAIAVLADSGVTKTFQLSKTPANIALVCAECGKTLGVAETYDTHKGTTFTVSPHSFHRPDKDILVEKLLEACDSSIIAAFTALTADVSHEHCLWGVRAVLDSYDENLDDSNLSDYLKIIKSIIYEGKGTYHDSCMPVLFDMLRKVFKLHDGKSFSNAYYVGRVLDVLKDTKFDSAVLDELIDIAAKEAAKKGK